MDTTASGPRGPTGPDRLLPKATAAVNPPAVSETASAPPPRLLDRLRDMIRVKHISIRSETAYVDWARRIILFNGKRHPADLGPDEATAFLTHLAVERHVSPSAQDQAKSALLFLHREVLALRLPWLDDIVAAKDKRRLPVVLTPAEARRLLLEMDGTMGLGASLLHGTGLRPLEGLRLRVKDIEVERREIGGNDRITVLLENLILPLRQQLAQAKALHDRDLAVGKGRLAPWTCCRATRM